MVRRIQLRIQGELIVTQQQFPNIPVLLQQGKADQAEHRRIHLIH